MLINDVVRLLKHIADPEGNPFNAQQYCAADMDNNSVILINDAVLLLKFIAISAPTIVSHNLSNSMAKIIISESQTEHGSELRLWP